MAKCALVLLEIITQILGDSTGLNHLNVMQVKSSSFFFNRRQLKNVIMLLRNNFQFEIVLNDEYKYLKYF
jgi:hypothetical protein